MSANALFVVAFVVRNFLLEPHYAFLTVQIWHLVLPELGLQCRGAMFSAAWEVVCGALRRHFAITVLEELIKPAKPIYKSR